MTPSYVHCDALQISQSVSRVTTGQSSNVARLSRFSLSSILTAETKKILETSILVSIMMPIIYRERF